MQSQGLPFYKSPKQQSTNDEEQQIRDVVAVSLDVASATAVLTSMLLCLDRTTESRSNKCGAFLELRIRFGIRWYACCLREEVDKFKNEDLREGATEIGDPEVS